MIEQHSTCAFALNGINHIEAVWIREGIKKECVDPYSKKSSFSKLAKSSFVEKTKVVRPGKRKIVVQRGRIFSSDGPVSDICFSEEWGTDVCGADVFKRDIRTYSQSREAIREAIRVGGRAVRLLGVDASSRALFVLR